MVSTVQVACPDCDLRSVAIERFLVHYCVDVDEYTVSFRCPVCERCASVRPDRTKVLLLITAGVPVRNWALPDELTDPKRAGHDPVAIDEDEWRERVDDALRDLAD